MTNVYLVSAKRPVYIEVHQPAESYSDATAKAYAYLDGMSTEEAKDANLSVDEGLWAVVGLELIESAPRYADIEDLRKILLEGPTDAVRLMRISALVEAIKAGDAGDPVGAHLGEAA